MQNRWIPLLELFGKLLKCKTFGDARGWVLDHANAMAKTEFHHDGFILRSIGGYTFRSLPDLLSM
jgi:hypothetical protein